MANFNTDVNIIPDRGASTGQSTRVHRASYGDGYEQRVAAGINTLPEEWSLSWNTRSKNDANKVIRFLENQKGVTAFDWYPPDTEIASTTTSAATNKLIDTTQSFTNRLLNTTVTDQGANTAKVTSVDSSTQLTLSSDLMANNENYTIYPTKKYKCEKWDTSIPFSGYRTVSATFVRVFEP
jgi:phage-related protein|tara:strand:+ start:1262 stop:1804 length:543 start_codon:yes stop_codon:yes gene_type:complete